MNPDKFMVLEKDIVYNVQCTINMPNLHVHCQMYMYSAHISLAYLLFVYLVLSDKGVFAHVWLKRLIFIGSVE